MILILIFCDHLPTSANFVIEVPNPGTNCGNLLQPDSFDFATKNVLKAGDNSKRLTGDQYSVFQYGYKRIFLYRKRKKKTLRMLLAD